MSAVQDERLSGALQENILTVLCFDEKHCRLVRHAVSPQLFESKPFREVAGHAIDFLDQFGKPIAEHLPDYLEDVLKGDDARKASTYTKLVQNLFASRETVNGEYVVSQVQKFVRAQNIKSAIVEAAEAVDAGNVDAAEVALHKGLKSQIVTFDSGLRLSDPAQALQFFDHAEDALLTGIDCLDQYGVGPSRKTLFLLLAPVNRGKSWWLIHLGKWALLQRCTVLHVTLEMSAHKTAGRYLQSFFSITKRQAPARVPEFVRDSYGAAIDISFDTLVRPSLADHDIQAKLASKIRRELSKKPPLIIKEFPSGALTMSALEAYLDGLERFHNVVPDLILVDYADLMQLDPKDKRGSIGTNMVNLRGLAVKRNCMVATASQTNREGIGAKLVDETNLSEDISKGFTADTIVSYNQTQAEHAMQIARLYVAKHRDDEARMMALVTQAYAMGQFCLDSAPLLPNYWNIVGGVRPDEES